VVVVVRDLEQEPIEDFAVRIGKDWGVGRKREDRGIVVALSTGDRRVFIATGYGVEGFLPDGRIGGILDERVVPRLRESDWSGGIEAASDALTAAACDEFGVAIEGVGAAPPRGRRTRPSPIAGLFGLLLAIVFLVVLFRRPSLWWALPLALGSRRGRRGRSGGWMGGGFGSGGSGSSGGFGGFGGGGFGGGGAGRGF
jgi:uncharacterized protein